MEVLFLHLCTTEIYELVSEKVRPQVFQERQKTFHGKTVRGYRFLYGQSLDGKPFEKVDVRREPHVLRRVMHPLFQCSPAEEKPESERIKCAVRDSEEEEIRMHFEARDHFFRI